MVKSGKAVMENVRRYRAIASLHRQTAALRPLQRWSLLDQAEQWERLAVAELEAYFDACGSRQDGRALAPHKPLQAMNAAGWHPDPIRRRRSAGLHSGADAAACLRP